MKGTLFSADFIKDSTGNLRLLELNTDTAFWSGSLAQIDFTDFFSVLSSNNIDTLEVIYKGIHTGFVELLSQSIQSESYITSFLTNEEDISTIYPISVEDADNKFILRLAYDESAIFDSTYCKNASDLHKLFIDGSQTTYIPSMYISSSEYFYDGLNKQLNSSIVPDLALKTDITSNPLQFYKVPTQDGESVDDSFANFISEHYIDSAVLMNYFDNEGTYHKSIRSFNIIYGSNLDIVNLATIEPTAVFEKPTSLSLDGHVLSPKHYYEFTTNFPKYVTNSSYGGVFEEEMISDVDGNPIKISDTIIGNSYKSFFIEGTPNTDSVSVFTNWNYPGQTLPVGSYVTSSVLINKISQELPNNLVSHLEYGEGSFRANGGQHILIYDSVSDLIRYEEVASIVPGDHKVFKLDGTLIDITDNNFEVLNEDGLSTYILDLEETDTFALYDNDINIKIVTHNCFPAGTRILLSDGSYKNIEELTTSDLLLTYNSDKQEYGKGTASNIRVSVQNKLVHISTDNGEEVKSTPLHKFYTKNDGWKSAEKLEVGDVLLNKDGVDSIISSIDILNGEFEVYYLIDVKDNHTYFAENILVHNGKVTTSGSCFKAGTKISMSDGSIKNIEDVVVGDFVKTFNEVTGKIESKKVYQIVTPIHNDMVKYILSDGSDITSTFDHPYYVNGLNLASLSPDKTNRLYDIEKEVVQIKVGDVLNKLDGDKLEIHSLEIQPVVDVTTYLLRVEDNHNFYANEILVHNK